jgi:hypothetical protein
MSFQTLKTMKSKAIAPAFVSGSHTNISFTYNTGSDVINASGSLGGGGGSSSVGLTTVSSFPGNAYTISSPSNSEEIYLISNSSTAVTINLPTSVGLNTKKIRIKRLGTANVTIDAYQTETIDGSLTKILNNQYSTITLISNDANWFIVNEAVVTNDVQTVSTTSTLTLTAPNTLIRCTNTSTITLTLPNGSTVPGYRVEIKRCSTGQINIATSTAQIFLDSTTLIGTTTTLQLLAVGQSWTLIAHASGWDVI